MPDFDQQPLLKSSRLHLRPLVEADADALMELAAHPEVRRYWGSAQLTDFEGVMQRIEQVRAGLASCSVFEWCLTLPAEGRVMGLCSLHQVDLDCRRAEVGFGLGREHWGKGYMREALDAMCEFAFDSLDLRRLEADVDPRNAPSLKLLGRMGFQHEGLLRERWILEGEIQDSVVLGLLRREWLRD